MQLYQLRCYQSSLQGSELPNPKSLLAAASRASKSMLGRLGVFSVSSFHALVRLFLFYLSILPCPFSPSPPCLIRSFSHSLLLLLFFFLPCPRPSNLLSLYLLFPLILLLYLLQVCSREETGHPLPKPRRSLRGRSLPLSLKTPERRSRCATTQVRSHGCSVQRHAVSPLTSQEITVRTAAPLPVSTLGQDGTGNGSFV